MSVVLNTWILLYMYLPSTSQVAMTPEHHTCNGIITQMLLLQIGVLTVVSNRQVTAFTQCCHYAHSIICILSSSPFPLPMHMIANNCFSPPHLASFVLQSQSAKYFEQFVGGFKAIGILQCFPSP